MRNSSTTALERLLRPLAPTLTPAQARALAPLQAEEETKTGHEELASKPTEGRLTPDEPAELGSIVRANTVLGVLKAEAEAFPAHAEPA